MLLFIILILSKIAISIHLMLLFIGVETLETGEVMEISIHLMLLFILAQLVKENNYLLFQYISCYCLSMIQQQVPQQMQNFNTSHVTVYLLCIHQFCFFLQISIHLMLLFI